MILAGSAEGAADRESTMDKETATERKANQCRHKIIFWQRRVAA